MKLKLLIIPVLFLIALFTVNATIDTDDYLVYYDFSDTNISGRDALDRNDNYTMVNQVRDIETNNTGRATGKAIGFDGTTDYLFNDTFLDLDDFDNITIDFWIFLNKTITTTSRIFAIPSDGTDGDKYFSLNPITDDIRFSFGCGDPSGDSIVNINPDVMVGHWTYFAMKANSTGWWIYMNDTIIGSSATKCDIRNGDTKLYIGRDTTTQYFPGFIDEFAIHYKTGGLSVADIEARYNYGAGYTPFGAAVPPLVINDTRPIITIDYPSNKSTIDNSTLYPLKINGTVTIQNGTVGNLTINNTNWKNWGNTTNFNFSFNGTGGEGLWSINFTANSTDGNLTTYILDFTIDITNPQADKSTLDGNRSIFYAYNNITFQINVTDNFKLYSFNVSTTQGYKKSVTNINTTKYIFNGSINVSTYGIGNHTIITEFCDAHTKSRIDNWEYEKDNVAKELKYTFGTDEYISIRPVDATLISSYDTTKEIDRYTLTYSKNPLNKQTTQKFLVTSDYYIDIIGNTEKYQGWLVIPKLQRWVDFNILGKGIVHTIRRISPNQVEVTIEGIKTDTFTFNSIGDLNCGRKDYKFYVYNYTAFYTSSVIETTTDTITLQVDYKDIVLNLTSNPFMNYNSIEYAVSNVTKDNQINLTIDFELPSGASNVSNLTFFFDFGLNDTAIITNNFTQTITRIQLVECGGLSNVPTLNISIHDEQAPSNKLIADIDAVFNVWTNDSTNFVNTSFDLNGRSNYSLCIFPNTTIFVNSAMSYNTSNGFRQRWFLRSAKLTTNTSFLTLYNFDTTTGIDELRGTLRDTAFNSFPNIYTELQRFYTAENVWRTVQKDRSDGYGSIIFNIIEKTEDYRMNFYRDNILIDDTGNLKFTCDANNICEVTFIVRETITVTDPNLVITSAYDNASQMFQVNWTDGTGLTSSVRLLLTKETGTGFTSICDKTVSSSSGTINCNTTGFNGYLKAQVFSTASPELPVFIFTIYKAADKLYQIITDVESFRLETSLWASGILITLIGIGLFASPIITVIIMAVGMYFMSVLGLVSFFTTAFIIGFTVIGLLVLITMRRER